MTEHEKLHVCEFPHCRCPIDKTTICARGRPEPSPVKTGSCDLCGRRSGELVDGACLPCRRKYQPRVAGEK